MPTRPKVGAWRGSPGFLTPRAPCTCRPKSAIRTSPLRSTCADRVCAAASREGVTDGSSRRLPCNRSVPMKLFTCPVCRQLLFFENVQCGRCGHTLDYLPEHNVLSAFDP